MSRFFEISTPEDFSRKHKKIWDIDGAANIGPVNTNISDKTTNIKLIIICESPSYSEVAAGFQTVCLTGSRIFNHLLDSKFIKLPHNAFPSKYCFSTHHQLFEKNGIYLTNLVKFQADYGIKDNTKLKNKRVKDAWRLHKDLLFKEIDKIRNKFGITPVLLAVLPQSEMDFQTA